MPPQRLFDVSDDQLNFDRPLANLDQIRLLNQQRFEMEQLTGILYSNPADHSVIGFKDVRDDEFWVRGHMPGFPLLPGVLMCEAAAQLASWHAVTHRVLGGDFIGFGGMDTVRFRGPVFPGDRLVIWAKLSRLRKGRRAEFEFQGFVGDRMVFDGCLVGVPMNKDQLTSKELPED
jgi:3-hydroxyacyl-[acyl-carrier-protein] dehydratase